MAWTTFVNSTTADASEVNDNFYHTRQGDLLPMGNASMQYTSGGYDLGSSTYTWANAHIDTGIVDNLYMEEHIYMNTTTAQMKVGSDNIAGFMENTTSAIYVKLRAIIMSSGETYGSTAHAVTNAMTNRSIIAINPVSFTSPRNPYDPTDTITTAEHECRFVGNNDVALWDTINTAGAHALVGLSYDDTKIYAQRASNYTGTVTTFFLYVSYTK